MHKSYVKIFHLNENFESIVTQKLRDLRKSANPNFDIEFIHRTQEIGNLTQFSSPDSHDYKMKNKIQ